MNRKPSVSTARIVVLCVSLLAVAALVVAALGTSIAQAKNDHGNPNPHKYTATPDYAGTATANASGTAGYCSPECGTGTQMAYDDSNTAIASYLGTLNAYNTQVSTWTQSAKDTLTAIATTPAP